MPFQQSDAVIIKRIKGKGRGVFARRAIAKGETIESVPLLLMTDDEYAEGVANSPLKDYCFRWGTNQVALALGYGSIYNHSYKPNARYDDIGRETKAFVAIRDIAQGDEITINYMGHPKSRAKVWFDVVDEPSKSPRPLRDESA